MNPVIRKQLVVFVLGVFLISWGAELPLVVAPRVIHLTSLRGLELLFVASVSPSLMAIVLTAAQDGWSGVGQLLRAVVRARVRPVYYVIALALPTALSLAAHGAPILWGAQAPVLFIPPPNPWAPTVSPPGEELGWRGYALPRMQSQLGALRASLLVGAIWALWHLPQWYIPGARIVFFPIFFVRLVAESVFMGWLYNNTRRSLWIAILAHVGMNLSVIKLVPIGTGDVLVQLIYMGLFCGVAALIAWRTNPATLTADRQPPLSLVVDGAIGTDHADRQTYPA